MTTKRIDLPVEDLAASRADKKLQRRLRKEVVYVREEAEATTTCPNCGTSSLAWFGFRSPDWTWGLALCGTQGVAVVCDDCGTTVAYFESMMS